MQILHANSFHSINI